MVCCISMVVLHSLMVWATSWMHPSHVCRQKVHTRLTWIRYTKIEETWASHAIFIARLKTWTHHGRFLCSGVLSKCAVITHPPTGDNPELDVIKLFFQTDWIFNQAKYESKCNKARYLPWICVAKGSSCTILMYPRDVELLFITIWTFLIICECCQNIQIPFQHVSTFKFYDKGVWCISSAV